MGDWLRSRRGQRQPWQIMPDTDESLDLMRRHRDAIRDARIFAGADETRAAEESAAAAALFDARARRWAYDFNQPVTAFYDRYMPDYRAAREGKDALSQAALYEQTPMGDAARASLERDIHDFGAAVDNIVAAGKLPSNPVKMLGQTPLVMQLLGRDTVTGKAAAQGGIYAAPHVFDGTHPNMTPEMWKQIPAAMADPIAVFDSDSPAGRARGDLVFMLELTDANGATVVVPVALQAKGKLGARINIVKSAYAKESGGVPSNHWFMRQLKKNARYVNGQKVEPWLRAAGAASPLGSLKDVAATNTSDNRIYTDADLVNLREAQPALYQPQADAVSYPNNGRAVGSISPEIARTLRLDKPGAIVLDDIGLQHIEDRHGKEIRGLGFADARAFVDAVLADVSAVYDVDGGGRKYDLVSRTMTPQGRVMVRLEFAEKGDFYQVATAGPLRPQYYNKKRPLWERAQSNHSPKGTPDAISGQSGIRQDAADNISLGIGNREVNGDPRARVTFDAAEGGRAVIEFFSAADASSAPHELYHIFRREMAESAARPDAPQRVREDWARIEEFVGAEPGQAWTREMEETFARAGERFLLEGKAPTPALQGVFERLRQWFLELYANADAAGLHISPAMREVFGNMLSVPAGEGDMAFRRALGRLLSRPVGPEGTAATPPQADMPPLEEMRAMMAAAEQELDRALTELGATMMPVVKGRKQAHANLVKSAYSKESGGVPSNNGFIRQAKKNARSVNGQKWKHWRGIGSGADSPLVVPTNASGNTVYSEADLVNLRQGDAVLDQTPEEARDLKQRFADMPLIEADSTQWFGEGKEMPAIPTKELDAEQKKLLRDSVQEWAKQHFGADTLVSNADRGWDVRITAKGIKDTLHHGFDSLLARSVPFIPQIIESGIHLDSIEKKPGLMSHIFANKIRLDGQDHVVGFVLREDDNGNRFYDHELTKIIDPEWLKPGRDTSEEALGHQTNRGDVMNILREHLGVNDGTGQVLFQSRRQQDGGV